MIRQFSRFTSSGPGLEKTLRLIQALAQIVSALSVEATTAARWGVAKSQLGLTRRYFRFFNFIEFFGSAYNLVLGTEANLGVFSLIQVGKWSCLGLYTVLEDLTLLDAMGVWSAPWNQAVFIEANKFWFYALSLSILGSVYELAFASGGPTQKPVSEKPKSASEKPGKKEKATKQAPATEQKVSKKNIIKQIVISGCDLMIPGSLLGWTPMGSETVGMAMVLSTMLQLPDLWAKAQGN
ncbi:hypothetical protein ASPZODRAFT_135345 [Penicilliopsis zonata CBS 506.65]|uniref:PEX11 domain protein n=1 Tax=Penicilliopsis zonata CBS 506.65 TaxID=1073090 RepID=A0A1L9S9U6_9EURO|nr:hypothetical protein ASPZODRAFT_135345 [Penicilliopsis zonata CBS 506.65]OJJ43943.1 hypothetical protein ASPZODRAFT_135345 [Penicilliopsis zonata CBS 506.65]